MMEKPNESIMVSFMVEASKLIDELIDRRYRYMTTAELICAHEYMAQAHREALAKGLQERAVEIKSAPPLDELGLPTRAYWALRNDAVHQIQTIAQLERLSDREILRMPNIGKKSLRDIRAALAAWHARQAQK